MILEFQNVTGKGKEFHLENVNFSLEEGYMMGVVGKNGAGKTTLIHSILNDKSDYDGEIYVCGKNLKTDRTSIMNEIGFISDENNFMKSLNASENVWIFSPLYRNWSEDLFTQIMEKMNLPKKTKLENFSRGEYVKFQLAFAIAHKSRLYLIDEATAGMDLVFRKDFFMILRELIQDEEASILMTSHIKEELEVQMDYLLKLEHGKMTEFGENSQIGGL